MAILEQAILFLVRVGYMEALSFSICSYSSMVDGLSYQVVGCFTQIQLTPK